MRCLGRSDTLEATFDRRMPVVVLQMDEAPEIQGPFSFLSNGADIVGFGKNFFGPNVSDITDPDRIEDEMNTQVKQRRVHFSEVEIGQRFFDLISAEYFIKQSATTAAMVTGIGDGTIADEFEPDDAVRIEE